MANIISEWDYELKDEVFRLTGDKGYTHKTQTVFKEIRDGEYRNTSIMAYFTAKFKVTVNKDVGDSYIVIYDGNHAVPFTVDGVEYTQYKWTDNTTEMVFVLRLGYDVTHNLKAMYRGNQDGLPSQSQTLEIYEPMPNLFTPKLTTTVNNQQFNSTTNIQIPLTLKTENVPSTLTKTIKLYNGDEYLTSTNITLSASGTGATGTATATIPSLDVGYQTISCIFDGDEDNESITLNVRVMVGYYMKTHDYPASTVECEDDRYDDYNIVKVRVNNWRGVPQTGVTVTAGLLSATTDNNGDAVFVTDTINNFVATYQNSSTEPLTVPKLHVNTMELVNQNEYVSRYFNSPFDVVIINHDWSYGEGTFTNIPIYITSGEEEITSTRLKSDGTAIFNYTASDDEDVTLTAICGDTSINRTYGNVWQYWNSYSTVDLNRKFSVLRGELLDLYNGYKLKLDKYNQCLIGLGDGTTTFGSYEIEFKVTAEVKNITIRAGGWRNHNGDTSFSLSTNTDQVTLKTNRTYHIRRVGNRFTLLEKIYNAVEDDEVINTLIDTTTSTMGEPAMYFAFQNEVTQSPIILNNIKVRKL